MSGTVCDPGATVAVTGATGFLGSHICDVLLAAGYQVRAAARATSDLRWLRDKPLEIATVDLGVPDQTTDFLAGCQGIVHCAGAITAPEEAVYQRANVESTRVLLEGAAMSSVARVFLLISSLAAHGPAPLTAPADENSPCRPITGYGRSKRDAEQLVLGANSSFRTGVLRPPSLYGPRDEGFPPLLRAARRGWTARLGWALGGLSMVDGRDCAAAVLALMETAAADDVYFIDDGPGTEDPESLAAAGRRHAWGYDWDEIRAALAGAAGRPLHRFTVPLGLLKTASRLVLPSWRARTPILNPDRLRDLEAPGWVCRADRLREVTGWRPTRDLATGMRETMEFGIEQGWL